MLLPSTRRPGKGNGYALRETVHSKPRPSSANDSRARQKNERHRNNRGNGTSATKLLSLLVLAVVTLLLVYSSKVPHLYTPEFTTEHRTAQEQRHPQAQQQQTQDLSETYRRPEDTKLPRASSPFLDKLATCDSLDCLRETHMLPRGAAKFNHPHFLIIGFQKAATTSLYSYLARHNETLASSLKEPEFFVNGCGSKVPEGCSRNATVKYLHSTLRSWIYLDWNGTKGSFEGSTHIVREGIELAPRLLRMMPWLKLIVNLREPISRAASMLIHNEDRNGMGCLSRKDMGTCLLYASQITKPSDGGPATYYDALYPWVNTWPANQLMVIQYEELTQDEERERDELTRVKTYLGLDLSWPKAEGLELRNARRFKINADGWKVPREQYLKLVEIARSDMIRLLALLGSKQLVNDRAWAERWERVWEETLETCPTDGAECTMVLS